MDISFISDEEEAESFWENKLLTATAEQVELVWKTFPNNILTDWKWGTSVCCSRFRIKNEEEIAWYDLLGKYWIRGVGWGENGL